MRATDLIPPAVVPDPHPPPPWMTGRLVVALERLPQSAYVWDDDDPDVVWDDTTPERVWDAPFIGSGYTDVWCDLVDLQVGHGPPDLNDNYPVSFARLRVRDPGDGRYRTRTVDGRLVYWALGRRLSIWWLDPGGVPWWIFNGQIGTWREALDGIVTIEAQAGYMVGRSVGRSWTAGTAGQLLGQRAGAILGAFPPVVPYRTAVGDVTLSLPAPASWTPLDGLRQAAWSDGGIVYTDADDTLIVTDRRWRDGRADQIRVPVLSDNVCATGPGYVVVWDPELADSYARIAGSVRLVNDAPTPLVAVATAPAATVPTEFVYSHQAADLWQTQGAGDALAAFIAAERSTDAVALGAAAVYLHDRRFDYWVTVLDMRLGDRVRFQHTDPAGGYDVTTILTACGHTITPNSWVVNLATSPAFDYTAVELWDWTLLTYDDPSPLAVWR